MLAAFLIMILGLMPSLLSLWVMHRTNSRMESRLRQVTHSAASRRVDSLYLTPEHHHVQGVGYIIGDFTCRFNARSSYIRCAVNPSGPCDDCLHYQKKL